MKRVEALGVAGLFIDDVDNLPESLPSDLRSS
jgi:hypothetical protein